MMPGCFLRWLPLWVAVLGVTGSFDGSSVPSEPRALAVRTDYRHVRGPELDGRLSMNEQNFAVHLGGFCFGHTGDEDDREVAKLEAKLVLEAEQPISVTGGLYLAFFDARDDKWGKAKKNWETSSCAEKLSLATYMDFTEALPTLRRDKEYTRFGTIFQHTATRDWHAVFLGCDVRPNVTAAVPSLKYEVVGIKGALSVFQADNFHPNSCPNHPVNWWTFAVVDKSFWILIAGFIVLYAIPLMFIFRQCRRKRTRNETLTAKKLPADLENAAGYPCDKPNAEIDLPPLPVGKSSEAVDALQGSASPKNVELRSE